MFPVLGIEAAEPFEAYLSVSQEGSQLAEQATEHSVHLFTLFGQSNMRGMDPETGFMTDVTA